MWKRALYWLAFLIPVLLSAAAPQATVDDSGSTNSPGLRVTIDGDGHATVQPRNGKSQRVELQKTLCVQFLRDLKDAGPLNLLPARHCFKSASFGSRLTIEFDGGKSPDLSCPGAADPRVDALQKDARELLQAARQAAGIHSRNVFTVPAPNRAKS